jgi:hypothetical protein
VTFEVVADEAILIDMETGTYFSLNEVGTLFWKKLDGETTIAVHAQAIARRYRRKTADFISELRQLATNPIDVDQRTQQLAATFNVDEAMIKEQLPRLAGAEAESHANSLALEFAVGPETVTRDLLELSAELSSERLVEIV